MAWAAAAIPPETATAIGTTHGEYRPGLLALRAGPVLEEAVRALDEPPDVLIVDATGRDHPRRAGLAVHLGAQLDIPTIGVTHRTLLADGEWPEAERGAHAPLTLEGETVGAWLRIQPRARPIAVHAGWRTDAETAVGDRDVGREQGPHAGAATAGPPRGAVGSARAIAPCGNP